MAGEASQVVVALLSSGTLDTLATNLQADYPGISGPDLALEGVPAMYESAATRRAAAAACTAALLLAAALL